MLKWLVMMTITMMALPGFAATGEHSNAEFLKVAKAAWARRLQEPRSNTPVAKGQSAYVPMNELIRGQDEISVDNTRAKLSERINAQDLSYDSNQKKWQLNHDGGRSTCVLADPIDVVRGPNGYVIVDGHHDYYLALYVDAKTIPIRVVDDLSALSPLEFWRELKARQLVFLKETAEKLALKDPDNGMVGDFPNRYLAGLIALKAAYKTDLQTGALAVVAQKSGTPEPVWIKVNESIPFIEFYIAHALADAGIFYDAHWGTKIPQHVLHAARQALIAERASGRYPLLSSIPLITTDQDARTMLADKALTKAFLERPASCKAIFSPKQ